jgi:hypothetical protein
MLATLPELDTLKTHTPQTAGTLTVVPLLGVPTPDGSHHLLLDEALKSGTVRITEVSEGGVVPELLLVNDGGTPVLLLDGEELVGAKQNRILNLSLLAPARAEIRIPVSCVEAHRWSWRSRHFEGSDRTLYAEARRRKMADVSLSMQHGSRRSDQGAIWEGIASKSARLAVHSDTGAAAAMYEGLGTNLDAMLESLETVEGQTGAAFLIDGHLVGVELFATPRDFGHLFPKLVRSYGLDAIDRGAGSPRRPSPAKMTAAVEGFLEALRTSTPERHPGVGLGEDWRVRDRGVLGAALVHEGHLLHLSAFTA